MFALRKCRSRLFAVCLQHSYNSFAVCTVDVNEKKGRRFIIQVLDSKWAYKNVTIAIRETGHAIVF